MRDCILAGGLFAACVFTTPAFSAPYIPEDGAKVIERLPSRNDPVQRELQNLRTNLTASPTNVKLATELARRYIEAGRSRSDPRYFGYAQATLSPWWNLPKPPSEVRLLRATLLQNQHRFPEAMTELNAVLNEDSSNGQAWLTRATILQVQGDYQQSASSCAKLFGLTEELVTVTCMTGAASLNGRREQSYALLETTIKRNTDADPGIKVWAITVLAEIATRKGDFAAAEQHFRQGLALDPADSYLLGAYADLLLDRGRLPEVITLLKNSTRVDGLLLRYAIALKRQGAAEAKQYIDLLQARFAAAAARNDTAHQREQARSELHLQDKPSAALEVAKHNWTIQKEPADARILLEAALTTKDKAAAQPVLNWLRQQEVEDVALQSLASKIAGNV